ncbi:GtrA family protein [Streptomyces sp. NBC_01387]|uniref:GtrA family protein n=1 Tax=unclassified Streptomyces TaxID=2593676 RepID=UPI002024EA52|nr:MULTISPECIES: GtrA family protein [unclassified Streptomyces]MCX4547325.1 GtrA family protein [Streptomyces sp. NBC_01500]WSC19050.1 GtrA family protein [Streptomyces sp. NBC_01766]WSV53074.1 GtrA family protein [Streptomyces sp. NBC_01014]
MNPQQSQDTRAQAPQAPPTKTRTLGQFLTFAAIGVANTAVYYAVYATLNRWIPYLEAHVLGWAVSITFSFLLNSYITCRTRPTWRAFARYPLSGAVNVVGSGILLYLAVSLLGMNKDIAALAAGVLVTPFSFLLARWAIDSGTSGPKEPVRATASRG